MQVNEYMRVERQIILNLKLDVLVCEDPPDGYCKSYMYYLEKNNLAGKVTWGEEWEERWKEKWEEEVKEFDPLVEILILSHGPISAEPDRTPGFSFMVSLVSSDEFDKKQWRQIRDVVRKHLSDFEQEKFITGGKPFLPKVKDPREPRPKIDLEILILSDRPALDEPDPLLGFSFDMPNLPLNLSFMVSFVSSFELDIKQWREIGNVVQKYLRDFEQEQSDRYFKGLDPTKRVSEERYFQVYEKLFYPTNEDLYGPSLKAAEIEARLKAAFELKEQYKDLRDRIRKNHKSRGFLRKLAAEFGMPLKEAKETLNSGKDGAACPAQLAMKLLLKTGIARINFICSTGTLAHEIIYREPRRFFEGYKKGAKLNRPFVYLAQSDSIQPDTAVKNYNTQGLRLKRLTVEKVWQGRV